MGVTFRREVNWPDNGDLLTAHRFGVSVPHGLSVKNIRAPNFVDVPQMMQLVKDKGVSKTGGRVYGYVKPDLTIRFANFASQWRRSAPPGGAESSNGPYQYQFTGGEVFIDLSLGVYIASDAAYDLKDDLSVQIFARVYEHELLHVQDETDILNNWLPPRLKNEPEVRDYLESGKPTTYGNAKMTAAQVQTEFEPYITRKIETAIFDLWAEESNRREQGRDAPAQYRIVQEKVNELRARQVNRR
jgi:hypothetical protein